MVFDDDKLREECGVFGIFDPDNTEAARSVYYGLLSLQHRGQESAGIAVSHSETGEFHYRKGMGLVNDVFKEKTLDDLKGNIGVGHVRYSTTGGSSIENAQPVVFDYRKGSLAMAHNGNIVNGQSLRKELMEEGMVFRSSTDSEVVACLFAKERAATHSMEEACKRAVSRLYGSYAIVLMSPGKLVAMRDPLGIKPLCIGKRGNAWVISSESCGLKSIDAEMIRNVEPGEIITITRDGMSSNRDLCSDDRKKAHCVFEYIYFARLDSVIDDVSVYEARFRGGRMLAKLDPVKADIVTGVPDSGLTAAAGYAAEAKIPFVLAFQKNNYMGRTFIKPTQEERESAVHIKLNVIDSVVKGKKIVLIDDSIVRGTTIKNLIHMLRMAGALEVHVRISSPPFTHPCYYGTDVPDNTELIATRMSVDDMCRMIGADSLDYMRVEDLDEMTGGLPLCKACFDGKYPTAVEFGAWMV